VLDLARQFNGSGHHASAGAILDGDVTAAAERIVAAATAHLDEKVGT
jgi:nanoRNase/pAp phosphatase (c-di-AMP/oligoRNAs hydrolase)